MGSLRNAALATALCVAAFLGCGPGCGDSCDGDKDCDGDQICFDGKCAPPECADCPGTYVKVCSFVRLDCRFISCN